MTEAAIVGRARTLFCKLEDPEAVREGGWTAMDGKLPVNRSGGLQAKGHPIGAAGHAMHVIGATQLTGTAGAMQLPRAEIGGVFNMGGAGVANRVSNLEPMRG
jgi:acetyl-CoA C-acetyltransferase